MNSPSGNDQIIELDITAILIDEQFSMTMPIDPLIQAQITALIQQESYRQENPILVWLRDGVYILADGLTRLNSVRSLGWTKIPAVVKPFPGEKKALEYSYSCQTARRMTDPGVILYHLIRSHLYTRGGDRQSDKPRPKSSENIARLLGVGLRTVERVREKYLQPLSEDQRKAVREGKLTVYDIVRGVDEDSAVEIGGEAADNTEEASETSTLEEKKKGPRRKPDEIFLQKLALTDAEVAGTLRLVKELKISVRDHLTQLTREALHCHQKALVNRPADAEPISPTMPVPPPAPEMSHASKPGKEPELECAVGDHQQSGAKPVACEQPPTSAAADIPSPEEATGLVSASSDEDTHTKGDPSENPNPVTPLYVLPEFSTEVSANPSPTDTPPVDEGVKHSATQAKMTDPDTSGSSQSVEKTWELWHPFQCDLLLAIYDSDFRNSFFDAAKEYVEVERSYLGDKAHSVDGAEHKIRRLLAERENGTRLRFRRSDLQEIIRSSKSQLHFFAMSLE